MQDQGNLGNRSGNLHSVIYLTVITQAHKVTAE